MHTAHRTILLMTCLTFTLQSAMAGSSAATSKLRLLASISSGQAMSTNAPGIQEKFKAFLTILGNKASNSREIDDIEFTDLDNGHPIATLLWRNPASVNDNTITNGVICLTLNTAGEANNPSEYSGKIVAFSPYRNDSEGGGKVVYRFHELGLFTNLLPSGVTSPEDGDSVDRVQNILGQGIKADFLSTLTNANVCG